MSRRTVPLNLASLRLAHAPSLALELPARRGLTSVNVVRSDKGAFDDLQSFWSFEMGRPLAQWDCFTLLLSAAFEPGLVPMPPRRKVA